MQHFNDTIDSLRAVGEHLVSYNFPKAPAEWEEDIAPLKKAEIDVDGYSLTLHYNKANYEKYILETFQVMGRFSPFLPFSLVVNLGRRVLGGHHLSLVEFYQDNRKVYCWGVCVDEEGKPIPSPIQQDSTPCQFEGFEYSYMHPEQLNFY